MKKKISLIILLALCTAQTAQPISVGECIHRALYMAKKIGKRTGEIAHELGQQVMIGLISQTMGFTPTGMSNLAALNLYDSLDEPHLKRLAVQGYVSGVSQYWNHKLENLQPTEVTQEAALYAAFYSAMALYDIYTAKKLIKQYTRDF